MRLLTKRPLNSYGRIQRIVGDIIRNKRWFIDSNNLSQKSLLNVGCGSNVFPEFINLDYNWRPGIDICWNIERGLPLANGSLLGIFSEHCLEHVGYWACVDVLKEFFRILAPGGVVRIIVPDAGLYLTLYGKSVQGELVRFPYVDESGLADREEDGKIKFTPMMAVNRIFRGYGHMFAYDFETLASMLAYSGFKNIEKVEYRKGRYEALLIDSELRAPQSLYIEAAK